MLTALLHTAAAFLFAQAAQPPTSPPPERPTEGAGLELLLGVSAGSLATSVGLIYWGYHRRSVEGVWTASLMSGLLLPPAAFFGTLIATDGRVRPSRSQAMNGGMVWTTLNLTLPDAMRERFPTGGLIFGPALGLGLGALVHHALDPASGQVSAFNSGGMLGGGAALMLYGPLELGALESLVLMDTGLLLGAGLGAAYPRSRKNVLAADALAYISMLPVGAAVSNAETRGVQIVLSAIPTAVFLTAYMLIPDLASAEPTEDPPFDMQLTSGDALFTAPGQRQGGLGLLLTARF